MRDGGQQVPVALLSVRGAGQRLAVHRDRRPQRRAGDAGSLELRRRMRDYVRGLLAPVARKNTWQLVEQAGHSTPDGLQHLLAGANWQPDDIRDDVQKYAAN
ncbi:hypothetical protein PV350_29755 [Streptomyces sp. PA03-6a]|nr:hypothetical protein [Streptomyces sp. PA03-6a]